MADLQQILSADENRAQLFGSKNFADEVAKVLLPDDSVVAGWPVQVVNLDEVQIATPSYALRADFDSETDIIYVGEANPGTADGSALWRIKKVSLVSGIDIKWANGSSSFVNSWDARLGLSYS